MGQQNKSERSLLGAIHGMDPEGLLRQVARSTPGPRVEEMWQPPSAKELQGMIEGYEVASLIGRGGMGAVYKVFHRGLQRECALKLLPESYANRVDFEQRFLLEARSMAQLDHSHIAHIYDSGQSENGHLYYVMEYVDGYKLSVWARDAKPDVERVVEIIFEICEALEYAHQQGCVHRDIKPDNIMISSEGKVKLVDFGLAKILTDRFPAKSDPSVTMIGDVLGTPGYMAPEQFRGEEADQRVDIYSLGVIMYELLTGLLPQGNFDPPSELAPIPPMLDKVVMKSLKSNPSQRYQEIQELKADLVLWDSPQSGNAASSGLLRSRYVWLGLLAIIAAVSGVLIVSSLKNGSDGTLANTGDRTPVTKFPKLNQPYQNSLQMPFVPVRGTRVLFGKWEVRWSDWDAFLADENYPWQPVNSPKPVDHPAMNISWTDAQAFCRWLTKKEQAAGLIGESMQYRLPTDEEWSIAADLGSEHGDTPAQRSGGVKGVYPWGRSWPVPESVTDNLDGSDVFHAVAHMISTHELFSRPMDVGLIEEYKRGHFRVADQSYTEELRAASYHYLVLPEYIGQAMALATDESVIRYWNDQTVVLMGPWMGHHADWIIKELGWDSADWMNSEFREFFVNQDWAVQGDLHVWSSARREAGAWVCRGKPFSQQLISKQGSVANGYLYGSIKDGELIFRSDRLTKYSRPVLLLEGRLSRDDLKKKAVEVYAKLVAMRLSESEKVCRKFLPAYESEWSERGVAVSAGWTNGYGIQGLCGGAKEWVQDHYRDEHDSRRTMRGGALRLRARGPSPDEFEGIDGSWIEFLSAYAIAPGEELLTSHRQAEHPDTRRPWYGFRPVLAFESEE